MYVQLSLFPTETKKTVDSNDTGYRPDWRERLYPIRKGVYGPEHEFYGCSIFENVFLATVGTESFYPGEYERLQKTWVFEILAGIIQHKLKQQNNEKKPI